MGKIKISKIRDVKSPSRGTELSAGIDFYVPEKNDELIEALKSKNKPEEYYVAGDEIVVKPHCRILIPSGIKVKVNPNTALIAYNKSGVASKKGLAVMACVVDEDYQGEVHISLVNTTDEYVKICFGDKITQFIEEVIEKSEVEIVPVETLYETETSRGEGGFGSTGTK